MIRQFWSSSRTRSSWHRGPMPGMGRECGIPSDSPSWSRRSTVPASNLAARENGGVLISPCNQANGLGGRSAVLMLGFYAESGIASTAIRPDSAFPADGHVDRVGARAGYRAHDDALRLATALQEIGERMDHAVFPEPGHGGACPGRM